MWTCTGVPFGVSFQSQHQKLIFLNSYQMVSVIFEQFRNPSENLLLLQALIVTFNVKSLSISVVVFNSHIYVALLFVVAVVGLHVLKLWDHFNWLTSFVVSLSY